MLRIYLLGGFRAEADSRPLPVHPGLAGLWAYLLLHSNRPVSRDQLAFTLWLDHSEAEARARLRQSLRQLRCLLPSAPQSRPWLLEEKRSLRWNPDSDTWLDVAEFQRTVESGDCERMSAGLDVYHGDLLPGLPDEWLLPERARLREQYRDGLRRLVEMQTAHADYAAARVSAEKLFHADPRSEAVLRSLACLRYLSGDRAAALRIFDETPARRERDGLAGQFSPETLALREAIARGEELPALEAPDQTGFSGRFTGKTAYIGAKNNSHKQLWKPFGSPSTTLRGALKAGSVGSWIPAALTILLARAALWIYRSFRPLQDVAITGPESVQSTWIVSNHPEMTSSLEVGNAWWLLVDLHDGRGPVNPLLPFSQYPAARVNLAGNSVVDALLRFDLAQLPTNSRVASARLTVYLEPDVLWAEKSQLPPVTIAAYRLLRDWDAATATFDYPWAEPGLRPGEDYDLTPLDRRTVLSPGYLTFDLGDAFPDWQRGRNFGIIFMALEAPEGYSPYWLVTAHHPNESHWPRLIIQYR